MRIVHFLCPAGLAVLLIAIDQYAGTWSSLGAHVASILILGVLAGRSEARSPFLYGAALVCFQQLIVFTVVVFLADQGLGTRQPHILPAPPLLFAMVPLAVAMFAPLGGVVAALVRRTLK